MTEHTINSTSVDSEEVKLATQAPKEYDPARAEAIKSRIAELEAQGYPAVTVDITSEGHIDLASGVNLDRLHRDEISGDRDSKVLVQLEDELIPLFRHPLAEVGYNVSADRVFVAVPAFSVAWGYAAPRAKAEAKGWSWASWWRQVIREVSSNMTVLESGAVVGRARVFKSRGLTQRGVDQMLALGAATEVVTAVLTPTTGPSKLPGAIVSARFESVRLFNVDFAPEGGE